MKKIVLIITIIAIGQQLSAQAVFLSKGKIEFERRTNVWAGMKGSFAEELKKSIPQFKTNYFDLIFEGNKAIYKPGRESDDKPVPFYGSPANDNEVYSNFSSDQSVAKKEVFDKTFLIQDSLRHAKWQIKNDFREIAGFNCRRATTIIMDSVFVVAFYTDEITVPGGPESFSGLPGMILGLVINRVHTTWYATKIEANPIDTKQITPPTKGDKTTEVQLKEQLNNLMKNWGEYGQRYIWNIMI